MKKTKILYWTFTGIFAGFMIFSALPDAQSTEDAVKIVHTQLGYPEYIIPFLGIAKIIGSIILLIPGFNRLKEWAYAGLMFDLVGATYSIMKVEPEISGFIFMGITIGVGFLSYYFHHRLLANKRVA